MNMNLFDYIKALHFNVQASIVPRARVPLPQEDICLVSCNSVMSPLNEAPPNIWKITCQNKNY